MRLWLWVWLAAAPSAPSTPLPERVELESETESFTALHDLAIRDGKLWWKPRGAPAAQWTLIPPDGLPTSPSKPAAVTALSADGDNLVAFEPNGRVHYTKLKTLKWTDQWGPVGAQGPLSVAFAKRGLAMSHRLTEYEDTDGNPHPISAGVTTFYALDGDGRWILYADPWLPPKFERRICLPHHGALVASSLSASASTLMVIDAHGNVFTRLADFDTVGDDPFLPYSYTHEKREGVFDAIRTLPGEDWVAQPPIPGPHSVRGTIRQTGLGNAARELRVEGDGGHWHKLIRDVEWTFEPTGVAAQSPMVEPGPPVLAATAARALTGTLHGKLHATVTTADFDNDCSPAHLKVESALGSFEVELHFHGIFRQGDGAVRREGALLHPQPLNAATHALFGDRPYLDVGIGIDATGNVQVTEIPRGPGPGDPLLLQLSGR